MCGIAGLFSYAPLAAPPRLQELERIRDRMAARGPDGAGEWASADGRALFGHRRLAIIDPTARADQPMVSADGRYAIVFNGEIYNHAALRRMLEARGRSFRTTSDTEVILQLYAERGASVCGELEGMFAFAIYDSERRALLLARDPYGIKPLYYGDDGGTLRFASQVKALSSADGIDRTVDPAALAGFGLFGHVPEPFTMIRGISALPAGCTLSFADGRAGPPVAFASVSGELAKPDASEAAEASAVCREALRESVARHLVADVEVGVFLSAGVDSGALLGMVRDVAGDAALRAVTLSFEAFSGTASDEAPLAAAVAVHYGCAHLVRKVGRDEFDADTGAIFDAMDQPSIDGINTWFVAKAAREAGLKAALSGVGGDELFAGYSTFRTIPAMVRATSAVAALPGFGKALRVAGGLVVPQLARDNPKALAAFEYGGTYPGAYLLRRGLFMPYELPALIGADLAREGLDRLDPLALIGRSLDPCPRHPLLRVAALEASNYMRNQLLRDADWAGMAHSLEIRTPFVDYRLLRAVAPYIAGLGEGAGKRILASAPSKPLPDAVLNRAKSGFAVPTASWMAGAGEAGAIRENTRLTSRAWARRVLAAFAGQALAQAA